MNYKYLFKGLATTLLVLLFNGCVSLSGTAQDILEKNKVSIEDSNGEKKLWADGYVMGYHSIQLAIDKKSKNYDDVRKSVFDISQELLRAKIQDDIYVYGSSNFTPARMGCEEHAKAYPIERRKYVYKKCLDRKVNSIQLNQSILANIKSKQVKRIIDGEVEYIYFSEPIKVYSQGNTAYSYNKILIGIIEPKNDDKAYIIVGAKWASSNARRNPNSAKTIGVIQQFTSKFILNNYRKIKIKLIPTNFVESAYIKNGGVYTSKFGKLNVPADAMIDFTKVDW